MKIQNPFQYDEIRFCIFESEVLKTENFHFLKFKSIKLFRYDAVSAMRAMEKFTQEVGGYPFLYADIFMTRDEFEKMFDLTGRLY